MIPMKIIIGSNNKTKIDVARRSIKRIFHTKKLNVTGCSARSKVPETPYGRETFVGALNRARDSAKLVPNADYYIGLESGLVKRYGHIYEEAWAVILDKNSKEWHGFSSGLKVPDYILEQMNKLNKNHGDVMAFLENKFGKLPNDTWGTYSGGIILRKISLEESLRNALIQIIAPENSFYKKE